MKSQNTFADRTRKFNSKLFQQAGTIARMPDPEEVDSGSTDNDEDRPTPAVTSYPKDVPMKPD